MDIYFPLSIPTIVSLHLHLLHLQNLWKWIWQVNIYNDQNTKQFHIASESTKTNEDAVSNGNISIATEDPKSLNNLKSTTDLLDSQDCNTTWYMKLTWFLSTIVYVFGIIVTIVYFSALFPYIGVTKGFIHDLDVHAFNTLQIFIDMAIIARPVRLLHAIYPLIYGAIYLIFSVIYWSQDKKNNVLYPGVLDWNQPERTGLNMVLLAVLGIPLLQMILFGIFRLRLYVYKRVYGIDYLS